MTRESSCCAMKYCGRQSISTFLDKSGSDDQELPDFNFKDKFGMRFQRLSILAFFLTMILLSAVPLRADIITLQYSVIITERAMVVPMGSTPIDPRISLSLGPFEAYDAQFSLKMTLDTTVGVGIVDGGGADNRTKTTLYGTPSFFMIPLPTAVPLLSVGDSGAEQVISG